MMHTLLPCAYGADYDQNERRVDTTYVNNKDSMLGYVYHAAFWTATKRL